METKRRRGSERVQPDSGAYLANERVCQGAFASHPSGMALPAHRFVLALVRAALARPSRFSSRCNRQEPCHGHHLPGLWTL